MDEDGKVWAVYILLCSDGNYYVGHSNDVLRRVAEHNSGQGAVHTACRRPVKLLYTEPFASEKAAIARESQLKRWNRAKKEALINGDLARLHQLSRSRD